MKILYSIFVTLFCVPFAYSEEKQGVSNLPVETKVVYDICFSAKGGVIAVTDNKSVKVFNSDTRELLRSFDGGHRSQITSVDISRDSSLMVSGSKDSTIVIWDFVSGKKIRSLDYHKGIVTSVRISPDNRYLVSGGTDHVVCLYNLKEDLYINGFTAHTDDITSVAFSSDGKLFAAGSGDRTITIYSAATSSLLTVLEGHTSWVRDLSFSHDGKSLVSCGDDARIMRWDVSNTAAIRNISGKKDGQNWILCIDNSDDDRTYAYADITGSIKVLWPQGIYTGNIKVPVTRIVLRPNRGAGFQIAVATRGKGVMLIDGSGLKLDAKKKYNYFPFKS